MGSSPEVVARRKDLEHQHQRKLFKWAKRVELSYPGLNLMFAIPNGGYRGFKEGLKLKEEGVKAGVPDIFLPVPLGGYAGLWIEMKAEGGKVAQRQGEWITALLQQGYRVEVAVGFEEAKRVIDEYYSNGVD